MRSQAQHLAQRLARDAEAVCRRYLPAGKRSGRYWLVGNIHGHPGQSLAVRLEQSDTGAAGKWNDAATDQHGDLLDIIKAVRGFATMRDAMNEAQSFLGQPKLSCPLPASSQRVGASNKGSPESARRLLSLCRPIAGTLAETYFRARGITYLSRTDALRFHPGCFYRDDNGGTTKLPTIVAAVTDVNGQTTGCHRTFLDQAGRTKAAVAYPRRAIGDLLGHGVRFSQRQAEAMVVSEGIEDLLTIRDLAPNLSGIAALSAGHLAAIVFPAGLRRLYIALDQDTAGENAASRLADRAAAAGIQPIDLRPIAKDWNEDLQQIPRPDMLRNLTTQLLPEDATRFLLQPASA